MKISLIAAMAENRVISKNNKIPWEVSAEKLRIEEIVSGRTVIMGRKAYESIGHINSAKKNIVITTQKDYVILECNIATSFEDALKRCEKEEEVFILGGEETHTQALTFADKIYLFIIHRDFKGDKFFPEFSKEEFKKVYTEKIEAELPCTLNIYKRIKLGKKFGLGTFQSFKK